MCGIFGFYFQGNRDLSLNDMKQFSKQLFKLSETRGKEASGLAVRVKEDIYIQKSTTSASEFLASPLYKSIISKVSDKIRGEDSPLVFMGHSRMATHGASLKNINNQPVVHDGIVSVHNGIICNYKKLWEEQNFEKANTEVDSEIIPALVNRYMSEGDSVELAFKKLYDKIEGTASTATIFDDLPLLHLATNNGSLYYIVDHNLGVFIFASEYLILKKFLLKNKKYFPENKISIHKVQPKQYLLINLSEEVDKINLSEFFHTKTDFLLNSAQKTKNKIIDLSKRKAKVDPYAMRRCSKCILPESFPGIKFNQDNVCNFCVNFVPYEYRSLDELRKKCDLYRKNDGSPDCVVALSGGRDSCYGLHFVKKELGMNPIAYTYDWGMVTDLARRNIARMCGELGVEHILVSADIRKKIKNIRKNINAWLARPDLGIVTLLMAGDKQYFYYANKVAKEYETPMTIFSSNSAERTYFKSAFCGVYENQNNYFFNVSISNKAKMLSYFMKYFIKNPKCFNSSIFDTALAYYSSYFIEKKHYYLLYDYLPWDEDKIMSTLIDSYGWEVASDTTTTWRIGDGTAAFYNYIYYKGAGFTEHDTFLSHQIRENKISRDSALKNIHLYNEPRYSAIKEYADKVGFDADTAIEVIDSAFS